MSNNRCLRGHYRSLFLLVRIRSGRFRLTLPLALFLVDETLDILADLLWLVEKFVPAKVYHVETHCGREWQTLKYQKHPDYGFPPHEMIELIRELLNELRSYGKFSLVEVETGERHGKQRISVEVF